MTEDKDRKIRTIWWTVFAVSVILSLAAIILTTRGALSWKDGVPVRTYGIRYDSYSGELDFSGMSPEEVLEKAGEAENVPGAKSVKLDLTGWTADLVLQFCEKCPDLKLECGRLTLNKEDPRALLEMKEKVPEVAFDGTIDFNGSELPLRGGKPDLTKASPEDLDLMIELADGILQPESVDFGIEKDGHTRLQKVHEFMKASPDTKVSYGFSAFGKNIDLYDEVLDLNHIPMTDQGAEVREIIACMPRLNYLDMDFCEVDDDHMAAIREDFPDITVDWRIWFGDRFTARTDETRILASASWLGGELTPENTKGLKYCTKMKYLDIGHMNYLKDISFTAYMPDLEVLIIMMGNVTDISPLANCKHMEFLEIFTNDITDLSPLAEMHELKHLNICYNKNLSDMTPLYGLTQLERLWIGRYTQIPKEQIQRFKELAPNCEVNTTCGNPHYNWRWYGDPEDDEPKNLTPRYRLLIQQLGYRGKKYSMPWNDPKYYPHD
ncbi:MAG: hypothetical protein IJM61_02140 [Firmicutes bacterium]|nr:hypothetical protein [Bacillota bacterium]